MTKLFDRYDLNHEITEFEKPNHTENYFYSHTENTIFGGKTIYLIFYLVNFCFILFF